MGVYKISINREGVMPEKNNEMSEETREALAGAGLKWDKVATGKGGDEGPTNCPLCHLFRDNECKGCPVFQDTGKGGCVGTPYIEWNRHQRMSHGVPIFFTKTVQPDCVECSELALKERDYLYGLMPSDEDRARSKIKDGIL